MNTTPNVEVQGKRAPVNPRRRQMRRLGAALFAVLVACVGWLLLTRSPLTTALVLPRLSDALGVAVEASAVKIGLDGWVTLDEPRLRVRDPDAAGAATFAEAKQVRARLGIRAALSGRIDVRRVLLEQPIIRISQSIENERVNVAELWSESRVSGSSPVAGGPREVPRIEVSGGTFEIGEHGTAGYVPLRRIAIDGDVTPAEDAGAYLVRFKQSGGAGAAQGRDLVVEGRISQTELELSLSGLSLADWPARSFPSPVREQVRSLALEGEITRTTIVYDFRSAPVIRIELLNVALNLPAEAPAGDDPGAPLRMHGVSGFVTASSTGVTARLDGMLEDVPYHATLDFESTEPEAGFVLELRSDGFQMQKEPQIRRFLSELVRERIAQFGNPTGVVNTVVTITRGPPVGRRPGPISTRGTLTFSDGIAAFHKFPYEFRRMQGHVRFTDDEIVIESITGTAPSGATIRATGHISPLTDDAEVLVQIEVRNVPVDDLLEAAMKPGERRAIHEIFSNERYEELVARGLILTPRRAEQLRNALAVAERSGDADAAARLRRELGAPEFEHRGKADIDVRVSRPLGDDTEWSQYIEVRLPGAGVLPRIFPVPLVARDATIVIDDEKVEIKADVMQGLRGGAGSAHAIASLDDLNDPDADFLPDLTITAGDTPWDTLLRNAVRSVTEWAATDSAVADRLDQVLRDFRFSGNLNGVAEIRTDEHGEPVVHVVVDVPGIAADPTAIFGGPAVALRGVSGTIDVTGEGLTLALLAEVHHENAPAGPVNLRSSIGFGRTDDGEPVPSRTLIEAPSLDARVRIENLAAIISPEAGERLAELRAEYDPEGKAGVTLNIESRGQRVTDLEVVVQHLDDFAFHSLGARPRFTTQGGVLTVRPPLAEDEAPLRLSFADFKARVRDESGPAGTLLASGDLAVGGAAELKLEVSEGSLASSVTRAIIERQVGTRAAALAREHDATGAFDAIVAYRGTAGSARASGEIRPRSLAYNGRGGRVQFDSISGAIEFDGEAARVQSLSGIGPGWTAWADGVVHAGPEGDAAARLRWGLHAEANPAGLRAALPGALAEAFEAVDLTFNESVAVDEAIVEWRDGQNAAERSLHVEGAARFTGASLRAGVALEGARGTVEFVASSRGEAPMQFDVVAAIDAMRVEGVRMTNGAARVRSTEDPDEVEISSMEADCHGGRIAGWALLSAPAPRMGGQTARSFLLSSRASKVQFAPVLSELKAAREVGGVLEEAPLDRSRGLLDAEFTLTGIVGDIASRRGRGQGRVGQGQAVALPLLMPLIRVSNLQFPTGEQLDLARAAFYLEGDRINFEELSVASRSLTIYGFGTMSWPLMELDLQFNSRSERRIPLLSWALEGIRDELITTRVRGTLAEPDISLVQFSGAKSLLSEIFGGKSEAQRRMDRLEEEIRRDKEANPGLKRRALDLATAEEER